MAEEWELALFSGQKCGFVPLLNNRLMRSEDSPKTNQFKKIRIGLAGRGEASCYLRCGASNTESVLGGSKWYSIPVGSGSYFYEDRLKRTALKRNSDSAAITNQFLGEMERDFPDE
jgi:hypothetical protein